MSSHRKSWWQVLVEAGVFLVFLIGVVFFIHVVGSILDGMLGR